MTSVTGQSQAAVSNDVAYLSELSRLLPSVVIESLEGACKRLGFGGIFEGCVVTAPMEKHESALKEWWQQVEREGQAALARLTNSNLRLVVGVARKYAGRGLPLPDLVQEENLGLMRALERFNPHRGYKSSTYATWWIRQSVTGALADHGHTIRLPVHVVERVYRLNRAERGLLTRLNREPTAEEVVKELGWSMGTVEDLRCQWQYTMSLETPRGEEESATLEDFIEDTSGWSLEEIAIRHVTRDDVIEALEHLPPRLPRVLVLRFGFFDDWPRSLEEIGHELGVTRERIRQLLSQAHCLLAPITWEEPFGLFMAEDMACGTPVVAFNRGSAPEVVLHGVSGYVVNTVSEMAEAVQQVHQLQPKDCRQHVELSFDVPRMVDDYLAAYERILSGYLVQETAKRLSVAGVGQEATQGEPTLTRAV